MSTEYNGSIALNSNRCNPYTCISATPPANRCFLDGFRHTFAHALDDFQSDNVRWQITLEVCVRRFYLLIIPPGCIYMLGTNETLSNFAPFYMLQAKYFKKKGTQPETFRELTHPDFVLQFFSKITNWRRLSSTLLAGEATQLNMISCKNWR